MHRLSDVPTLTVTILIVVATLKGETRDYFKPIQRASMCDMLVSHAKHQWSPNGVDWVTPPQYQQDHLNGGSQQNWPKLKVDDDGTVKIVLCDLSPCIARNARKGADGSHACWLA
jgi:hypothetical protein